MFLLVINVISQGIQIGWSDRKHSITALPGKIRQFLGLCLEPHRRRNLQFFDKSRNRDRSRKADGEMNMIHDTSNARTLTTRIARDRGEIGMKRRLDRNTEARTSVFYAENEMEEDVVERLGHAMKRAFSPQSFSGDNSWGVAPGYNKNAPLALDQSFVSLMNTDSRHTFHFLWELLVSRICPFIPSGFGLLAFSCCASRNLTPPRPRRGRGRARRRGGRGRPCAPPRRWSPVR